MHLVLWVPKCLAQTPSIYFNGDIDIDTSKCKWAKSWFLSLDTGNIKCLLSCKFFRSKKKSTYACYKEPQKNIYRDFPYFIIQLSSYMGKLQLGKGYDKTNISSHLSPSGSNTTLKRWQIGSAFEQMFLRSSLSDKW